MPAPRGTAVALVRAARAQVSALLDQLDTLAAELEQPRDELLGVTECKALGVGRDALKAAAERGELEITRGPKQRLQVTRSELDRWLKSKPYAPKATNEPEPDQAALAADWERRVRRVS